MYLTAKQLFQVAQVPLSVVLSCVNILPFAVFCISFTGCANSHLICWKNSLHKWTCELYVQQSVQVLREGTTTISFCTEIALGCTTWIVLVVCSVSYAIPLKSTTVGVEDGGLKLEGFHRVPPEACIPNFLVAACTSIHIVPCSYKEIRNAERTPQECGLSGCWVTLACFYAFLPAIQKSLLILKELLFTSL